MTARDRSLALLVACAAACADDVGQVDSGGSSSGSGANESTGAEVTSSTDDGVVDSSSSSSTGIAPPLGECGNSILEFGEDCDDGKNGEPDDGCTDACGLPRCGDAFFQPSMGEQCDGGEDGDAFCSATCTARLARVWLREFGTSEAGDDEANGVAIDGAGNVIAVGTVDAVGKGALGRDIWTRKYTPDGRELWTRTYDSAIGSSTDFGLAVAATSGGDIYVGGDVPVTGQAHDGIILAYDASGNERWTMMHQGLGGSDDAVSAIAVGDDAVLAAGFEFAAAGPPSGWYTAYDTTDGGELWSGTVVSGAGDFADIVDVAIGPNGEWALAGLVDNDNWVRVLEPDGSERFELVFDAIAEDGSDVANGVAFTSEGDLVVAGSTTHAYARRFDPDGAEVWSTVYAYDESSGRDGAVTSDGTVVIAGFVSSPGTSGSTPALYGADAAAGALQWTQLVFDGGITGVALETAAGPDGTLAVAGFHTPHAFEGSDLWVAYYAPLR